MRVSGSSINMCLQLQTFVLMYVSIPVRDTAATPAATRNHTVALAKCLTMSSPSTATPRKILDFVTVNQYIIVPPSGLPRSTSTNNRQSSTTTANSKGCPIAWRQDFDRNRRPPILLKAVCPSSNTICRKCRAITYGHRVLKYKCNALWDWATVNLPVAYVLV